MSFENVLMSLWNVKQTFYEDNEMLRNVKKIFSIMLSFLSFPPANGSEGLENVME